MSSAENGGWQGPSLRLVLGSIVVLTIVFGVGSYRMYSKSMHTISAGMAQFDEAGKTMSADQCVDAAVDWYLQECDANVVMCEEAIGGAMGHCLGAQDRSRECDLLSSTGVLDERHGDARALAEEHKVGSGQWVFYTCQARGTECVKRKKCPCAEAIRAVDHFCNTLDAYEQDQNRGVQS